MAEVTKINNVSPQTRTAVARKSAQTLPNRPSEQGFSAEEIKRRFYQPVLDAANSALAEIDRVVNEANAAIGEVDNKVENFVDESTLLPPFKKDLGGDVWIENTANDPAERYEVIITQDQHGIDDFREIDVEMFLIDFTGRLVSVNNFDIYVDGTVRLFNENTGGGHVSVSRNRDGFVLVNTLTSAENVVGLATVAKSGSYNDLTDRPNIDQIGNNEDMISRIISGAQVVNRALSAETAQSSQFASTAGSASSATNAVQSTRAVQDGNGANIVESYARQSGNFPGITAGNAGLAQKALADEDNINIKENYAKKDGTYHEMSVGNATNAVNATRALQDGNGLVIADNYVRTNATIGNVDVAAVSRVLYPVGSIFMSTANNNPQTWMTGTTWQPWGQGRVPVGVQTNDTDFANPNTTGGDKRAALVTHTHLAESTGQHTHTMNSTGGHSHTASSAGSHQHGTNNLTGTAGAHSHQLSIDANGRHRHSLFGVNATDGRRGDNLANRSGRWEGTSDEGAGLVNSSLTARSNMTNAPDHSHSGSALQGTAANSGGNHQHSIAASGAHTHGTDTQGAHIHTNTQNGTHSHAINAPANAVAVNNNANLQPYITCFMWRRTA